ncbi:Low-affinity inorganic phosphate transporter 1 [BD1-7 clade bacterium]|uniref:Phosphate transporter n=1 Tax=BD1-7 clade bacterium TaxID=2029982 RepID=A0A5S9Q4Y1_9GAMM|nr:Low-affinity inorganic phosphate transporter 1 [BD1-7 clade bacterium]
MDMLTSYHLLLLILAIVFAFFMAWGVGANDVANAMATSVGSKALTIKHAIMIAAVFEFAGAYLAGGQVTSTIRKGIIDPSMLVGHSDILVIGMLAALLSAGVWLFIATLRGWPVSTTHTIVGAIVGFGCVGLGVNSIEWSKVAQIGASWITSPIIAGMVAFLMYRSVRWLIIDKEDVYQAAMRYVPVYMFIMGFIIAMVTFVKGLKHVGLDLTFWQSVVPSLVVAATATGVGKFYLKKVDAFTHHGHDNHPVERVFAILMIFTACSMAFAHGSNDVANAVGPLAAIYSVLSTPDAVTDQAALPSWILLVGAIGIVVGLMTFGFRVMTTVGQRITELKPSRGFAAEISAATTVVVASGIGLPISTTQTLVGAVLGVGLAHHHKSVDWGVIRGIVLSWFVTIPVGAVLSIIFFYILKAILGA